MLMDSLTFVAQSLWSATWWTAVGTIVTIIAILSSWVLNARRKNKKLKSAAISNSGRVSSSNVAAAGRDVTQHIVMHQYNSVSALHAGSPESSLAQTASRPDFWEIREALDSTTPYSRHLIAENYVGLCVSWRVEFISLGHANFGDEWVVTFRAVPADGGGEFSANIAFLSGYLRIEDWPQLKIANVGQRGWVKGQLKDVLDGTVYHLKDGFEIMFD